MIETTIQRIALIGAGNVAYHMGRGFINRGVRVLTVYSPRTEETKELAQRLGAHIATSAEDIHPDTQLVLIAVVDDKIAEVAARIPKGNYIVAHTSGVTPISILTEHHEKAGIFYPLQTLKKEKEVDFSSVPFCLEASDEDTGMAIQVLAHELTSEVFFMDSQQRRWMHLAAIFAANFSNYLYSIADDILKKQGLKFDLLHALIRETALRVEKSHPIDVQTGPAVRGDENTIDQHLTMLEEFPDYRTIYQFLSDKIYEQQQHVREL